jgi:hypothetical protein
MQKKILKYISVLILIVFTSCSLFQPSHSYAANNTGTIKVFSEVKDIEIFIDEKSQGKDTAEIINVEMGSHYIKAVKDGATIFSDLVNVAANATSTILIKNTGQVKENILGAKYTEQQEYKSKKLDILLSKSYQTTGTSNTYSTYFPGYYYYYWGTGYGTTTSKSTQTETTDWKIVQGGVQEISDVQFATLVNDKYALKRNQDAWDTYNNTVLWSGVIGLLGIVAAVAGLAAGNAATEKGLTASDPESESAATMVAVGIVVAVIGCGVCLSFKEPSGHLIPPSRAANEAYNYNQKIKADLGLPENYEP